LLQFVVLPETGRVVERQKPAKQRRESDRRDTPFFWPHIEYPDPLTFIEIKTSSVQEKSGFRYFYYTSGTKINQNARHLLLDIGVTQENPGYWKVDKWSLSDLSMLAVKLKNEFNASKTDLMDERAKLISS
jgi:hypothetical protein